MNLFFLIRNVSSILISNLQSHSLTVVFSDGTTKDIECCPHFKKTSLATGEIGELRLNNQQLGYGQGYSNAVWSNIDLIWQFSCEDEEGVEYWYEMKRHIVDARKDNNIGVWSVKYIG